MATPRRNKALSPDGQTAKFLYCIIKQLNLKSIDWTLVAASLEITNGHAARMRYSRFKQQMEGLVSQSRDLKPPTKKGKKEKEGFEKPTKGKKRAVENNEPTKAKPEPNKHSEQNVKTISTPLVKQEESDNKRIKLEPNTGTSPLVDVSIKRDADIPIKSEPTCAIETTIPTPVPTPQIKPDPEPLPSPSPDIWRLLPKSNPHPTLARDPLSPPHPSTPFGTPTDFTAPPYSTVSLSDLQLSPRSFAPANLTPTSPGSLVPRMMPSDGLDGLGDLDLGLGLDMDVDVEGLLQEEMEARGLEDGGWIITGEGKVGGG